MAQYIGKIDNADITTWNKYYQLFITNSNLFNKGTISGSSSIHICNSVNDEEKGIGLTFTSGKIILTYNGTNITNIYEGIPSSTSTIAVYSSDDKKNILIWCNYPETASDGIKEISLNLNIDSAVYTAGVPAFVQSMAYNSTPNDISYFYFNKGESKTGTFKTTTIKTPAYAGVIPTINEFTIDGEHSYLYNVASGMCYNADVIGEDEKYFIGYTLAIKDTEAEV